MPKDRTYSESEIAERLKRDLPRWRFADGQICRTYETGSWRATLMVTNAIGHLAEAAWHHPDILATFPRVEVRLQNHDAGGITDKDFELGEEDRRAGAVAARQERRRAHRPAVRSALHQVRLSQEIRP